MPDAIDRDLRFSNGELTHGWLRVLGPYRLFPRSRAEFLIGEDRRFSICGSPQKQGLAFPGKNVEENERRKGLMCKKDGQRAVFPDQILCGTPRYGCHFDALGGPCADKAFHNISARKDGMRTEKYVGSPGRIGRIVRNLSLNLGGG